MAAAAPQRRKREREGKDEARDPLTVAVLQNNIARFRQLWDQNVAAGANAFRYLLAVRDTAVTASNIEVLRIMASTTVPYDPGYRALVPQSMLEQAIDDNDLELVHFYYTMQAPRLPRTELPGPWFWPLFRLDRPHADHFVRHAHTDEMCQLGQRLFGYLLLTRRVFDWFLMSSYVHPKKPGQVAALLKYSVPWWDTERVRVGPGAPILPPAGVLPENIATPAFVSSILRNNMFGATPDFEWYKQLTSSALWRAGEFTSPSIATLDLQEVLGSSRAVMQAGLATEWAQYIITDLGADWTWFFPNAAAAEYALANNPKGVLAVLFDALTVPYLAQLLVQAWDSGMAQRFLAFAQQLTERSYLPERAMVLGLAAMFPGNVATREIDVSHEVQQAVPALSRIYRRVALLLRDVADVVPRGAAAAPVPGLSEDKRQHLRQLSTRLLARVAAAQPEHLAAVREVLESEPINLPRAVAEFTAFLPYYSHQQHPEHSSPSLLSPLQRPRRPSRHGFMEQNSTAVSNNRAYYYP